jgi:hypothetical protein
LPAQNRKKTVKTIRVSTVPDPGDRYHPVGVMTADARPARVASTGSKENGAMAGEEVPARGLALKTGPLLAGAVLIGIGSLLGLAGLAIAGAALGAAARRYVNNMEVPPSELAKQNLAKARAAASAGASAWRNGAAEPAISDQ